MKTTITITTIILTIFLFSFAPINTNESIYSSKYIKYSVERNGSTAVLNVEITDIDQYDEIYIRRSDNPMENFRQVKYLTKTQIGTLAQNKTIIDKYPLPGSKDTYYKVVAISKKGVYKLFPCVKLSKY